tara:strand:- start:183 stop:362 length:180 start_codon:yes stop_codon:yes gene_type:complete
MENRFNWFLHSLGAGTFAGVFSLGKALECPLLEGRMTGRKEGPGWGRTLLPSAGRSLEP